MNKKGLNTSYLYLYLPMQSFLLTFPSFFFSLSEIFWKKENYYSLCVVSATNVSLNRQLTSRQNDPRKKLWLIPGFTV
jgi:hypothetical protein